MKYLLIFLILLIPQISYAEYKTWQETEIIYYNTFESNTPCTGSYNLITTYYLYQCDICGDSYTDKITSRWFTPSNGVVLWFVSIADFGDKSFLWTEENFCICNKCYKKRFYELFKKQDDTYWEIPAELRDRINKEGK